MSHYAVLVIGDNPETQLEPFDENIEVAPYARGEVTDEDKKRMLDYYNTKAGYVFKTFEECYKEKGIDWNGNRYRLDEDGVWREYTTYNPNSKWDWYSLGGRWSGCFIKLKDGAIGVSGRGSLVMDNKPGIDQAYKKDIDFEKIERKEFIPYAVIYKGEWISRGDMGWWGITTKEHFNEEEWEKKVWELIDSVPDVTLFSFYDLHI